MLPCYNCRFKRDLPGDGHVQCAHPVCDDLPDSVINVVVLHWCGESPMTKALGIVPSLHGIKNGWFDFPLQFDPIWGEGCTKFEPKAATPPVENTTEKFQ